MPPLYLARVPNGGSPWVMWVDKAAGRCYVYIDSLNSFRFHPSLTRDFYVDGELSYDPIDAAAARAALAAGAGKLDRRSRGPLYDQLAAGPALSVEQSSDLLGLGLGGNPTQRGAIDRSADLEVGVWSIWKIYPEDQKHRAAAAAYDLKSGKITAVRDYVPESRVTPRLAESGDGLEYVVEIRPTTHP